MKCFSISEVLLVYSFGLFASYFVLRVAFLVTLFFFWILGFVGHCSHVVFLIGIIFFSIVEQLLVS